MTDDGVLTPLRGSIRLKFSDFCPPFQLASTNDVAVRISFRDLVPLLQDAYNRQAIEDKRVAEGRPPLVVRYLGRAGDGVPVAPWA